MVWLLKSKCKCKLKENASEILLNFKIYLICISFIHYTNPSLLFFLFLTPNGLKSLWFCSSKPWVSREARVGFHGGNPSASTLTSLAKVVGRFTHEPGSIGRGLELRFVISKLKNGGSELLILAPLAVNILGLIRLQIDSTNWCKYSAIFVGVFTHVFHVLLDLGT